MPRANTLQPSFNAGELSPRMAARVDFSQYDNAAEIMENLLPLPQGGAARRPGTRYVADAASHVVKPRLVPFVFSTVQAYVLELGAQTLRVFKDQGQVSLSDTDAAISNGTFESNISNWDDRSTGAASISHAVLGVAEEGTWSIAAAGIDQFGDAVTTSKNVGFKFQNTTAGDITSVTVRQDTPVDLSGTAVAAVYTDSAGSPGSQVGGNTDSVTIDTPNTDYAFTWSSNVPNLSASTNYWVVLTDTSGAMAARLDVVFDQGPSFASGKGDDPITEISDASGNFGASLDYRMRILIGGTGEGALALNGASGETAHAEQDVTTTAVDQEHVLQFRVLGVPGDTVKLRIGTQSEGLDLVGDLEVLTGYHAIAFTPTASPFYVQFINEAAKTVHIDDVSLIDDAPLSVGTPYGEADLPSLKWAQTADVLYLVAGGTVPVYELKRRGDTSWSLEEVPFFDGPYLDENDTATTLDPGANTGLGVSLAASIDLFAATDVGRLVRFKHTTNSGYAVITEFTDAQNVTIDVLEDFDGNTAKTTWSLGAWSATTGYPSALSFFEQRSAWAGTTHQPQTFWLSQSADLENMRPDDASGTVEDDDAIDFTFAADQVNAIRWISPGTDLVVGTAGGEWLVRSSGSVLTPTDIQVRRHATMGGADVQPLRVRARLLFLQRARRKILEFGFNFEVDGFEALDMTLLADHITQSGIVEMVYQQEPDSTIWCLRGDGRLATFAYQPDQKVIGWSRQVVGGSFGGGHAVVESLAVIPGAARDEVWLTVKRTIGGETRRFVEFVEATHESCDEQVGAFFVDSGLSLDQRNADSGKLLTLSSGGSWQAGADGTLDAAGHAPFLSSDVGDVWGLWRDGTVAWVKVTEYTSSSSVGVLFLTTIPEALRVRATSRWLDPGTKVAEFSGLDHIEGEAVQILADGAVHSPKTVSGGSVMLDEPAGIVQAGMGYPWKYRSLKLAVGAAAGTAVAKPKRIHAVSLVLLDCLGVAVGPDTDRLSELSFRETSQAMDLAVPLFTGERRVVLEGDWAEDPRITICGEDPVPFTLLALAPETATNEML